MKSDTSRYLRLASRSSPLLRLPSLVVIAVRELVVFQAGEFTASSLRSVSSKAKSKRHVFVGHHFVRIPSAADIPVPCF